MTQSRIGIRLAAAALVVACVRMSPAAAPPEPEFDAASLELFEAKVRPLLAARCFECHGPEAEEPKGGLRLDTRAAVLAGGDSGPAVVPGRPAESPLIDAIRYEGFEMPPRSKLPEGEIAILTEWVQRGAPWPSGDKPAAAARAEAFPLDERRQSHWAWQPLGRPAPPHVGDSVWPQSAVDRFILAKLEASALSPAGDADRRALIRRAYFDLIGLPPSPDDVGAFLADPDPTPAAFEGVVDRLLASPQFGERWSRHWLDLVRYAETLGHEFDFPIHHAWRYRDYVVRALNADVPYDQFVREHIAGDLLAGPRTNPAEGFNESIIGTGFWYLGEVKHAPVDVRADEVVLIDNQIDVFSKAFLGLTVSCARCHDHKFDAISTKDYYALAGFLKSSRRQEALLDPNGAIASAADRLRALNGSGDEALVRSLPQDGEAEQRRFSRFLLATGEVLRDGAKATAVAARHGMDPADLERWVAALRPEPVKQASHPLHLWSELAGETSAVGFQSRRVELAKRLGDEAAAVGRSQVPPVVFEDFEENGFRDWFVSGEAFGAGPTASGQWDPHASEPRVVPVGVAHSGLASTRLRGVLRSKTFTITHPHILYRMAGENAQVRLVIDGYFMDAFQDLLFKGCAFPVSTGGEFRWHRQAGDVGRYIGHRAHIEIIDAGEGWVAVDEIRFAEPGGEPHIAWSATARALLDEANITSVEALAESYGRQWGEALKAWHAGSASREQNELVAWAIENGLVDLGDLRRILEGLSAEMRQESGLIPEPTPALALTDGTGEDERVHIRGSHKNLGEVVPRRMLEAIAGRDQPPVERGSGRLELADRLLDASNPLPPRVMVNRIWHHLFGRGIVESVDNFGVLGTEPTHPELLDHLAAEFMADGWSVKRLIRRVMLSRTYRMASTPDPRGDEVDPQNRLLHRAPIRRLEGEAIRDAMLTLGRGLDRRMAGPSVPVHLTPFMQGRGRPTQGGPLDGDGRRSVYIEVRRNFPPPMMAAFDAPTPFTCIGRRTVSNVPAQALILMNDPFVIEQARLWSARVLGLEGLTAEQRVSRIYEEAFGRVVTDAEVAEGLSFLRDQGAHYGLTPEQAPHDARTWADLCHVLMNVKEFIFLD